MATDEDRLRGLPEPVELLSQFSKGRVVSWGDRLPSRAEIADLYGIKATARSLRALQKSVTTEPRVTSDFLAAVPSFGEAHRLDSRVKSPASLARKFHDTQKKARQMPPDDLLRYTVLTKTPDDLVDAATHCVDELRQSGWRVTYAMHSYTQGSRYKGLHAYLLTPGGDRVEVQFHSDESAKVKEETTPWYEIERSARSTPAERTSARAKCTQMSGTLAVPRGLDQLTQLGGRGLAVNNYSDSRTTQQPSLPATSGQEPVPRGARQEPKVSRSDGINR